MTHDLDPAALTFADLRKANDARQAYWGGSDNWTLADWSNALAGEVGEACNLVKKIRRPELGTTGNAEDVTVYRTALKSEIGDVLIYLDLLAKASGAALQECVGTAFNSKSEKLGMPIRLAALPQGADPTGALLKQADDNIAWADDDEQLVDDFHAELKRQGAFSIEKHGLIALAMSPFIRAAFQSIARRAAMKEAGK